jgi:hypothetical protein
MSFWRALPAAKLAFSGEAMMKAMSLLLPALLVAGISNAQAGETYCNVRGGSLSAGVEFTHDWYVVNYKVRKPQLPGQTKPSTVCGINFNSVGGMHRPIEILVRPKLGEIKTTYNSVAYRSAKNGEDFMSIRFHRLGRTGSPESSVLNLRIHVVDRPL